MDTAYPVGRQDRLFYFRLFLLLRKASNAITRLPKAHNNVNMPMKIERISKAVIHATVFAPLRSAPNGCPPDIQRPFLCIPASRSFGVGRLPPCHGYFPIAYAMQLIYHFFCYASTILSIYLSSKICTGIILYCHRKSGIIFILLFSFDNNNKRSGVYE